MSPGFGYAGVILSATGVSLLVVPAVLRYAQARGLVDPPGGRKSHTTATPRIGGMGILAGLLAGLATGAALLKQGAWWNVQYTAILAGVLTIFAIGLSDDLLHRHGKDGLSAGSKLILQIAAAAIPSMANVRILGVQILTESYLTLPLWLSWLLTIFWVVGIVNAMNWIDGLDGLAGGVSMIMAATIAILAIGGPSGAIGTAVFALALVGGLVGFLRVNFPPAQIFMGDGGSHLLGYLLAVLAVNGVMKAATVLAVLTPMVLLALPILNVAGVVVGRVLRGDSPMAADRSHLHHRLQDSGWTDLSALLFVYAISGLCGTAALALMGLAEQAAGLALGVALLLVAVAANRARPAQTDATPNDNLPESAAPIREEVVEQHA